MLSDRGMVTRAAALALKSGGRVQIKCLSSRADLNGKLATLLHFSSESGRWGVRCDGSWERVLLKTANLIPVTAAPLMTELLDSADLWFLISRFMTIKSALRAEMSCTLLLHHLRSQQTKIELPRAPQSVIRRMLSGTVQIFEGRYPALKVLDAAKTCDGATIELMKNLTLLATRVHENEVKGAAPIKAFQTLRLSTSAATRAPIAFRLEFEMLTKIKTLPPLADLPHDLAVYVAAAAKYGAGADSTCTVRVTQNDVSNKAHYFGAVVSTPGGTEFDVQWRDGDAGADPVMLEDMFIKEHHKNPNESESDDFTAAFSEREMAAWLEKLKHKNLGFLVGALGNATTLDGIAARGAAGQRSGTGLSISASAIKIAKRGADFADLERGL